MRSPRRSCAFSLIELLLVIGLVAILVALAVPALASARRTARATLCASSLRQVALASLSYAGDARGRLAGFSWRVGEQHSPWPDLNAATRPQDAHSDQAVHILRTMLGKGADELPVSWEKIKDRNYGHLVLIAGGYLEPAHPRTRVAVCPSDTQALRWQDTEPADMDRLVAAGLAPADMVTGSMRYMLPFWSTYHAVPASFTPDALEAGASTFVQNPDHHRWLAYAGVDPLRTLRLQSRRVDEVAFPALKIYLFDYIDRHAARAPAWYAYPNARVPLAFFDGSVRVCRTGDSRPGGRPDQPLLTNPTTFRYDPARALGWEGFDPPSITGDRFEQLMGYYVWTLRGLRGADF